MIEDKFPDDFFPPSGAEIFETNSTFYWFVDEIQYIYCKPNCKHTIDDARQQVSRCHHYTSSNNFSKVFMICDLRLGSPLDKETRDFYSSSESQNLVLKFAFIVRSPISKVMANFFINLRKVDVPTKMFTDTKEAHLWCENDF